MALGDNTTSVARGSMARGRQPYMIQADLNFATAASDKGTALAANDVIPGLTIPANTLIISAGFEVTTAHSVLQPTLILTLVLLEVTWTTLLMVSTLTEHLSETTLLSRQTPVYGGTSDTIDIEIQAMTGTTTGGVIRMFAVCMDVDDTGDMTANEVDRDTLA